MTETCQDLDLAKRPLAIRLMFKWRNLLDCNFCVVFIIIGRPASVYNVIQYKYDTKRRFNAAISISAVIHKITNKTMLSQRNRAMQCVFPMPHDSDCYLLQLTKGQRRYSTGASSHLSTKSRLNVKLKINNTMAHVF